MEDEGPIGACLALLILVISSLHVYVSLWVFLWRNRSMAFSFLGYCISHLWTDWNALNSPSLPSYTNLAVGVLLFMLLLRPELPLHFPLATWCRAIGWTLPFFHFHTSTLGSNFFTFMFYAAIPTFQVYWAFPLLRLPSV